MINQQSIGFLDLTMQCWLPRGPAISFGNVRGSRTLLAWLMCEKPQLRVHVDQRPSRMKEAERVTDFRPDPV